MAVPLVLLLSACASYAPQDTMDPKGPISRQIDNLFNPVVAIAAVVFVLVEFGTLAMVLKFRKRKGETDDDLPPQLHGNTKLEIGWTVLPAVILAFVAVFTIGTLININNRDDAAMTVRVEGQQWWWEYTYDTDGDGFEDEDVLTANDLVIPAGQNVSLEIGSNDVIHSFWIPALNGKKDAVPGRENEFAFTVDEAGRYGGQCAEFCGIYHSKMPFTVVAVARPEYDAWIATNRGASPSLAVPAQSGGSPAP